MADRVVKVSLVAQVNNYVANMEAASKSTKKVGESLEAQKAASIAAAKAQGEAAAKIGAGFLAIGAIAAVGIGVAVAKFAAFDSAISNVKAATQESTENMALLREASLQAGADTAFSAIEAANAVEELGKAGLSTEEILGGGLNGALSLAAAGSLGVAEAAQIAAISMKQFGLDGSDVPRVADLLAAGAGKAVGSVEDLGAALNQAGLVANGAGQSIEDTTGVLAAFADAGLIGSDAGTSLKTAIIALQAPSQKASNIMDEYNLSFYDGQGQMLGYEEIAGQLETRLGGLDDETRNAALAQIFGNDALRSANVLYEQGEDGIRKYIDQTTDSGYAAKVAADRLNNLAGDVEALGGSFDTYLIKSGSGANDVLRQTVQIATGLVNAIGGLPEPVLGGALAVGGLVTAVVLASGAFLVGVPKVAAFKNSLKTLDVSAGGAARGIGLLSGGLAVAGLAFSLFAQRQANATATASEFQASLDQGTGAITDYTRELVEKKLVESGAFDAAEEAGVSQKELTDAILKGGDALDEVNAKISGNNNIGTFFTGVGVRAGNASQSIRDLTTGLQDSKDDFADQAKSAEGSAESTEDAAVAYKSAADTAGELQANLSTLIDTINEANGVGQDAVSQNINYQAALDDVAKQIENVRAGAEGYVAGISDATAEGRDNLGMLNEQAAAAQSAAKATFEAGGSAEEYQASLVAGRGTLIENARALGATADEADALADKIFGIPTAREINITANTAAALEAVNRFIRDTSGRRVELIVDGVAGRRVVGSEVSARAAGGAIYGPGTGTSDTAGLYALSNGEHVLTAAEVAAMGGQSAVYDFRRGLKSPSYIAAPAAVAGGGGGSSAGGSVQRVFETVNMQVSGRTVASAVREYDRSLR